MAMTFISTFMNRETQMQQLDEIITVILNEYGLSGFKHLVMKRILEDPLKAERVVMKIKEIINK